MVREQPRRSLWKMRPEGVASSHFHKYVKSPRKAVGGSSWMVEATALSVQVAPQVPSAANMELFLPLGNWASSSALPRGAGYLTPTFKEPYTPGHHFQGQCLPPARPIKSACGFYAGAVVGGQTSWCPGGKAGTLLISQWPC